MSRKTIWSLTRKFFLILFIFSFIHVTYISLNYNHYKLERELYASYLNKTIHDISVIRRIVVAEKSNPEILTPYTKNIRERIPIIHAGSYEPLNETASKINRSKNHDVNKVGMKSENVPSTTTKKAIIFTMDSITSYEQNSQIGGAAGLIHS